MSKARELAELSRTVSDSADAVAITIDSSENVTFANDITVPGTVNTAAMTVDTTTLVVDATNNRVGAGVASPQSNMHVLGTLKVATGNAQGILGLGEGAGTTVNVGLWRGAANNPTSDGNFLNLGGYDGIVFAASNAAIGSQTEAMRILSNQRVSIGGSSSNHLLNVTSSTTPAIEFTRGSGNATIGIDNGNSIAVGGTAGDLVLRASGTTGVTRFTDSGGDITMTLLENNTLLVGKTADDNSVGFKTNTNSTYMVASGQTPTFINRLSSAGDLLEFRKDSSTKGRIGTDGSDIFIGSDDTNLLFHASGVLPANSVGGLRDNAFALGSASGRFSDLRLAGIMYSGTARINTTTSNSLARVNVRAGSNQIQVVFQNTAGSTIGYIGNVNDSSTIYAQTSDARLKENIADAPSASDDIDAIQVRSFDWKSDGSHQKYGMVAQELKAVAPDAVFEPENADDMMGVDYSKLVPMLVKEIQSLRTRVAQLENN